MRIDIKAYWSELNDRERWVLGLGVAVSVLYVLYVLLYAPLTGAVRARIKQVQEKQATLQWMQQVPPSIKGPVKILTHAQLPSILTSALQDSSFRQFPYHLQQSASSEVMLVFEAVPFNAFMRWVRSLNEHYTISIVALDARPVGAKSGLVKLSCRFKVVH